MDSDSEQIQRQYLGLNKNRVQSGCWTLNFAITDDVWIAYCHTVILQSAFYRCFLQFVNMWVFSYPLSWTDLRHINKTLVTLNLKSRGILCGFVFSLLLDRQVMRSSLKNKFKCFILYFKCIIVINTLTNKLDPKVIFCSKLHCRAWEHSELHNYSFLEYFILPFSVRHLIPPYSHFHPVYFAISTQNDSKIFPQFLLWFLLSKPVIHSCRYPLPTFISGFLLLAAWL